MRLVSFNVNGVRARLHQLAAVVERHAPEVIGLQETKVADDAFPHAAVAELGYEVTVHGQKGHYGVALLTRTKPRTVLRGLPAVDHAEQFGFCDVPTAEEALAQPRLVGVTLEVGKQTLHVYNGYFPQGESRDHPSKFPNKRAFYARLLAHLEQAHSPEDAVVVMGDMNVAPRDEDIGIGEDNRKRWLRTGKCSFLPEERDWLQTLCTWGLNDAHAQVPLDDARFSWFDYRSRGFEREPRRGLRIDLVLLSAPLQRRLRGAAIDYDIRAMDKPSDHCPVWVELSD
jgi:exodeoxyribonuclease-3